VRDDDFLIRGPDGPADEQHVRNSFVDLEDGRGG
jgi:hypothetical protein